MSTANPLCMPNRPRVASVVLVVLSSITACSSPQVDPPAVDGGAPPIDPAGRFAVRSSISFATAPSGISGVLDELVAATDGPDDPSRYLIDLLVERLPAGRIKTYASELTPFLAAYVNAHIATAAPRFVTGVRALVDGLGRTARQLATNEDVRIDPDGHMQRTIVGLALPGGDVAFSDVALDDISIETSVQLSGDRLVVADHVAQVEFGPLLRLGFDRAVIPSVVPVAGDLAHALRELVDCSRIGELVADAIGVGPAALYAQACAVGLTTAATRIYDRLPGPTAPPVELRVAGVARATDLDGDGRMDLIEGGIWTGTFDRAALGAATFGGAAR